MTDTEGTAPTPEPVDVDTDLLVPQNDPDLYRALSAADERQVVQEIREDTPTTAVYSFSQGGKNVIGLSYKGVKDAIRVLNSRGMGRVAIAADPAPKFEEVSLPVDLGERDEDGNIVYEDLPAVNCLVYALDEITGSGAWGSATQSHTVRLRKKNSKGRNLTQPDPFARTKALSKASRNALEGFLPLGLVEELKRAFVGEGRVEVIPATKVVEQHPADTDPEALVALDRCRELYDEYRAFGKEADKERPLTPGRFGALVMSVQHDKKRIADLDAWLTEQIAAVSDDDK